MKTCSKLLALPMNIFNYEIQHTIIAVSAKYLVWGHFTGSSDRYAIQGRANVVPSVSQQPEE